MRLPLILTTAALALSGCVIQNPGMAPAPMPLPQVTPAPDAARRRISSCSPSCSATG